MTTRDKISQAYILLSGDATKLIVKKATTRIDDPPKKKHLLTLSQHCLNPRANLCHVFDCLSIRERKPDWRIASKALITMHHLLKTGNQCLWNSVASRPTIFDLCGYVDNSSHIDLEACDAAKMFHFYKESIQTTETLQNLINIATSLKIEEEAVRDLIRQRGSHQLQKQWF
ncbi:hypothetical protein MXB_2924 [Myxobolus squamalis]|nr:hypothetical protein MXB_2924 [Myxobolus squamalis]